MDLGRAFMKLQYMKDINAIKKWAAQEQDQQSTYGSLGGWLGAIAGAVATTALAVTNPIAGAAIIASGAGLGSYGGSKVGASSVKDINTNFAQSTLNLSKEQIKDLQLTNALSSAIDWGTKAYSMGLGVSKTPTIDPTQTAEVGAEAATVDMPDPISADIPDVADLKTKRAGMESQLDTLDAGSSEYKELSKLISDETGMLNLPENTLTVGDTTWDSDFIQELQAKQLADSQTLTSTGIPGTEANTFLTESGFGKKSYVADAMKADVAWQQQGGSAYFDDPWAPNPTYSPAQQVGNYAMNNPVTNWATQNPYLAGGMGLGTGLLYYLMQKDGK